MFKMHGRGNVTETAVGSVEQDTGERRRKHGSMQRKAIVRREEICQRAVVFQVAHGVLPANNIHADLCKTACVEYLCPGVSRPNMLRHQSAALRFRCHSRNRGREGTHRRAAYPLPGLACMCVYDAEKAAKNL